MPRIRPSHAMPSDSAKEGQFMDILLLRNIMESFSLSDAEAKALYKGWEETPPGSKVLDSMAIGEKYLPALNKKKYIERKADGFVLTERGRKVIIEMVTNQPNAFEKEPESPSYSQIKKKSAGINKRALLKRKKAYNLKEAKQNALRLTKQG